VPRGLDALSPLRRPLHGGSRLLKPKPFVFACELINSTEGLSRRESRFNRRPPLFATDTMQFVYDFRRLW
jgi:hypothetical protein